MSRALEVRMRRLAARLGLELSRRGHGGRWVLSDPRRPTDLSLLVADDLADVEAYLRQRVSPATSRFSEGRRG